MTKKVEEKLIKPKSNFSKHLEEPYWQSLFLNAASLFINATESSEILSEIKSLKSTKSSSPSGIPVKILKHFL